MVSHLKRHRFVQDEVEKKFFDRLKVGDVFTYSDEYTLQDVAAIAKQYGKEIAYCQPGSPEYKEYGCYTCKIVVCLAELPVTVTLTVEEWREVIAGLTGQSFNGRAEYAEPICSKIANNVAAVIDEARKG